jgi:hypothetical protein
VHLLSIDRPGYGASEPQTEFEESSYEARADDIAAFTNHSERSAQSGSGIDFGRIGVVGWQSGGFTALALAARHPRLVDRLAIIDRPSPANPLRVESGALFTLEDLGMRLGLRNRLDRMLDEASSQSDAGLGHITATTKLIYGDRAQSSSDADGHWFRDRIPDSTSVKVQNGGALSIVTQWERILEHVASRDGDLDGER